MSKKNTISKTKINPDFRRRTNVPMPENEQIEQRLLEVLTPAMFSPQRIREWRGRNRLLTLPVMVAVVLTLVWRQIASISELVRVLAKEGVMWIKALEVTQQAISKRLAKMPSYVFEQVFEEAIRAIRNKYKEDWSRGLSVVWMADGSTLEALMRRVKVLRHEGISRLGGKIMMVVDAKRRLPVKWYYTEEGQINDKRFCEELLGLLPKGGLLIFDLGFFSFCFFDRFTEQGKYFVTRLREKTSYREVEVISRGQYYRDRIVKMGVYRSNPMNNMVRLVEVCWDGKWHSYITNVVDIKKLSAREIVELYRNRWKIEEAFLLTKRLLGLSYLWVGDKNGIRIQVFGTWVFYAVLIDLSHEVAQMLGESIERISYEMVFRGMYHFSVAYRRGEAQDIVGFLSENARLLGIVKRERKSKKLKQQQEAQLWTAS
jgi:Transposase DDE domain